MMSLSRAWRSARNRAYTGAQVLRGGAWRLLNRAAFDVGPQLYMGRGVSLELYGELRLGARVHLGDGCLLSVAPGASLVIGDDVWIGRGTVVAATSSIVIGQRVLVAEHCTVRDGDHAIDAEARAAETHHISTAITIEDHVWIGAGVRVLRGAVLREGAVVAANAVVRGTFGPHEVIGGVPARVLRSIR